MGDVELVFRALADPTRRALLDELFARDGQTLVSLTARHDMTRIAVAKHLKILEDAGLIVSRRRGREKLHYLNPVPIRLVHDRWVSKYTEPWAAGLAGLKHELEDQMEKVFEIYIRTTPERLWQGLTDPAFTRRYWQTELHTDWAKGSPVTWNNHGVLISDPGSVVLESDPYRRLSYTWHTMTPELGEKFGWDQEFVATLASEPRSKVTFDIEPVTQGVKLTVIHDVFEPGSTIVQMISVGWPDVISSLKTLLETGEPLPA